MSQIGTQVCQFLAESSTDNRHLLPCCNAHGSELVPRLIRSNNVTVQAYAVRLATAVPTSLWTAAWHQHVAVLACTVSLATAIPTSLHGVPCHRHIVDPACVVHLSAAISRSLHATVCRLDIPIHACARCLDAARSTSLHAPACRRPTPAKARKTHLYNPRFCNLSPRKCIRMMHPLMSFPHCFAKCLHWLTRSAACNTDRLKKLAQHL